MTVAERRKAIMEILHSNGFIKITDIASRFDVSSETARRDLDFLQGQQLIHRTHGGAIPVDTENTHQNKTKLPLSYGGRIVRALAAATVELLNSWFSVTLSLHDLSPTLVRWPGGSPGSSRLAASVGSFFASIEGFRR